MKKLLFVLFMVVSGQVMAADAIYVAAKCQDVNSVSTTVAGLAGGSFGTIFLRHNLGRKPFGVPKSSSVFIAVWVLDSESTTEISIGYVNLSGSPQDATISFDYF